MRFQLTPRSMTLDDIITSNSPSQKMCFIYGICAPIEIEFRVFCTKKSDMVATVLII